MDDGKTYIQYLGVNYPLISELSLEHVIELYVAGLAATGETRLQHYLSIVSGIPLELVQTANIYTLDHLSELYADVLTTNIPIVNVDDVVELRYIDGTTRKMQTKYPNMKFGWMRRFEDFLAGRDIVANMHYLPSYFAWGDGEEFDPNKIGVKARTTLDAYTHDISEIYSALLSIIRTRGEFLSEYSDMFGSNKNEKKKKNSNSVSSKWGWYHVAQQLVESGNHVATVAQLDELPVYEVFELLSYMHDYYNEELKKQKQQQQGNKTVIHH